MSRSFEARTRASLLLAAGDPGNENARAEFAACYGEIVLRWCRRKEGLGDADREDVAQTVMTRLFRLLPTYEYSPDKPFRKLLSRMVNQVVTDIYRERKRRPGTRGSGDSRVLGRLESEPAPDDPEVDDLVQALSERMGQVRRVQEVCDRVRRRVRPHNWQAFWLTTVEGLEGSEVAARLGMSRAAVPMAKYRVIKMIREELGESGGHEEPGAARDEGE
jgi:RNA polymerase sigma-70 factor (ECF subfamily)